MTRFSKFSKKAAALIAAGILTCGLVAGCGGGGGDKKADSGKAKVLTFGCQMYSDGLIDPSLQTNTAWNCSRFGVGQTLFRFDDNVKAVPQLAESATPSDGNKTWVFKLKKGIKFSNGTEMTATKVKEYLDWIREAGKSGSTNPTKFLDAGAVVTADDAAGTVTIKSEKAYADLPASLADPAMVILDVKGSSNMKTGAIGTGPYMVKSFKDQVGYEMVANPHYWNGKPPYDEVKILFMGDASAKANALRAGPIDLAENIMNVADLKAMKDDKKFKVEVTAGTRCGFSWMNMQEGRPLANKALRQAIHKAIDYKAICKSNTIGNLYSPGPSVIPSSLGHGFDKLKNPDEYNPEEAKKILDAAGIKDTDGDGIRELNGQNIQLRYVSYANRLLNDFSDAHTQYLKAIGIGVKSEYGSSDDQWTKLVAGEYDLNNNNWNTMIAGSNVSFMGNWWSKNKDNYCGFKSDAYDAAYEELRTTMDPKRYEELMLQLQQILIDEAAVLVDGYYNSCIVYNNEKVGYAHIYPIDYYWITDEIKPAGAK
ncbi:MAG: ABC transporter substrate-binding protein [Oscillospiraceae bacterium]|nr:ABC transporter substrate-binding protein [Oscillospiraceae bacterium]